MKHLCGNMAVCIVPGHKGLGPAFVYNKSSWILPTNQPTTNPRVQVKQK